MPMTENTKLFGGAAVSIDEPLLAVGIPKHTIPVHKTVLRGKESQNLIKVVLFTNSLELYSLRFHCANFTSTYYCSSTVLSPCPSTVAFC